MLSNRERVKHISVPLCHLPCNLSLNKFFLLQMQCKLMFGIIWLLYFQSIFWIFMFLAIFHSCLYAKWNFVRFLYGRKPTKFMDFGYYIAGLFITLLWIHIWKNMKERVTCVLNSIETYENHIVETRRENYEARPMTRKIVNWVIVFEMISLVVAICKTVHSEELQESKIWSMENVILEKAEITSMGLMHWEAKPPGNDTYNIYFDTYGRIITPAGIAFGCVGLLAEFASTLLQISIRDTVLFLALTIYCSLKCLTNSLGGFANLPLVDVREEDCHQMERNWWTYCKAKDITLDVNWAFGALLKILHVCNELFFVYFMSYILEINTSIIMILGMLYTIGKFLFAYILAALIHQFVRNKQLLVGNCFLHSA